MATTTERAKALSSTGLTPLLTTDQLAAYYGVTRWLINEWVKRGCPVEPTAFRGRRFDLARVKTWTSSAQRDAA
ncbi:hypothetical protein EYS09_08690 [Streptomyces kasugaensis]|jgi:phage terminase Nu1 subunit (DNA packaging protein)|uniref:DNA-binding protein n=1 Tax=Streptomyces kasugaensis TaxID=1946 RepID=A0A4Q9HXV3_STRKA|nr:hypothetical protein [Streptomyces kasugaensis]TBO60056.1 hypothetical protein EYS09_08690 [Streptomyces kasugaensis]